MIHICEKKHGKLKDLLTDRRGNYYCCSCVQRVSDEEIDEKELAWLNRRYRR